MISVDSLAFGDLRYGPNINQGLLIRLATGDTIALTSLDRLSMEGVRGHVSEIRFADGLDLDFVGEVGRIEVGPLGFEANLSPTLLEYLYHNSRAALLLSGLVFSWGLLWGTRRLLMGP